MMEDSTTIMMIAVELISPSPSPSSFPPSSFPPSLTTASLTIASLVVFCGVVEGRGVVVVGFGMGTSVVVVVGRIVGFVEG